MPHISAVLSATGQLTRSCPATYARLIETTLMVVLCIGPDAETLKPAWNPSGVAEPAAPCGKGSRYAAHRGAGWMSCLRTRFIHAKVRAMLMKRTGAQQWDTELYGTPINQEDQLVTLFSFSYNVLRCLQQVGCVFSDAEREAFMHLWRLVGWMCGVPEHLLERHMSSYRACELASHSMLVHLVYPAAERSGGVMARHNLLTLEQHMPSHWSLRFHAALARFLLSDQWADGLELPQNTAWEMFRAKTMLRMMAGFAEMTRKIALLDWIMCKIKSAHNDNIKRTRPLSPILNAHCSFPCFVFVSATKFPI